MAEKALKSRIGEIVQGKYKLEEKKKPEQFKSLIEKYLVWAKKWQTIKHSDIGQINYQFAILTHKIYISYLNS